MDEKSYSINTIDGNISLTVSWSLLQNGSAFTMITNYPNYIWIFYDINGKKGKNRLGKDIFVFSFLQTSRIDNKISFRGSFSDSRNYWSGINSPEGYVCRKGTGKQYAGAFCGQIIFRDGWKISDDYPW